MKQNNVHQNTEAAFLCAMSRYTSTYKCSACKIISCIMEPHTVRYSTHSQVIIRAGGAGLQVEVREREEELVARAGPDAPVALSIRVVGQGVAGGGEPSRCSCQRPSTAWNIGRESNRQVHISVCVCGRYKIISHFSKIGRCCQTSNHNNNDDYIFLRLL